MNTGEIDCQHGIVIRARIPATTANMGPGFDCMGAALSLFNVIEARFSRFPQIILEGEITQGIPDDVSNLAYRAAQAFLGRFGKEHPLCLRLRSSIPVGRGLGSSAACIVGGMAVANALLENPLSEQALLTFASKMEGHPDNVTPALLGGVTLAILEHDEVVHQRFTLPKELGFVVAIPNFQVSTPDARNAIPAMVKHEDAVFNLSRAAMMAASLARGDFSALGLWCQDRLHQPYRSRLVPGLTTILGGAAAHGALACYLSGAGPTVACLIRRQGAEYTKTARKTSNPDYSRRRPLLIGEEETADRLGRFMVRCFKAHGISALYKVLEPCTAGTLVTVVRSKQD